MKNHGFTLLEVLVVLMIVSLITGLLMQSFSYVIDMRSRFLGELDALQRGALQRHWFRSSNSSLIPDYVPEQRDGAYQSRPPQIFKADDRRFTGLSLNTLHLRAGMPSTIQWELSYEKGDTILSYSPQSSTQINFQPKKWEIARWYGQDYRFQYQAANGEWHDSWPPSFDGKISPQLPKRILLDGQSARTPFTWLVSIRSARKQPTYRRNIRF